MNAYELADHLEKANYVGAFKAANMLRQQADKLHKYELRNLAQCDRIAILEAQNKQQADQFVRADARIAELENKRVQLVDDLFAERKETIKQADRIAELEKLSQLNDEILKPILIDFIKKNTDIYKQTAFFSNYDEVRGTKEKTTPQTKPLSDEEILNIFNPKYDVEIDDEELVNFARAIEERHGIK